MLLEESHNSVAIETSSAPKPLPKVLGSENILMHRIGPVPACDQVLYKLLQNGANRVLVDSPSDARTAE